MSKNQLMCDHEGSSQFFLSVSMASVWFSKSIRLEGLVEAPIFCLHALKPSVCPNSLFLMVVVKRS